MNRRGGPAAERFAERRRMEDEAPRLHDVVPTLKSLKIVIDESRAGVTTADVSHTRTVMIDHAPALFLIPCGDTSCKDGGHDITSDLVRGLRESRDEVRGEDTCYGHVGTADCGRIVRFTARAEYETTP